MRLDASPPQPSSPSPSGAGTCGQSASASGAASASGSPSGKRGRDPEDEVYLDNFHSHKRYLSEMMATSLNGLTVGDSLGESLLDSPVRSDAMCCSFREDFCSPYSPMSEDSDDSRYYDSPTAATTQLDFVNNSISPVSPHRHQKFVTSVSSYNPYPLPGYALPSVVCTNSRQRCSESEGRFPSSPNDMCHTADLRRTALLRSVQMRVQPHCSPAYELHFSGGQEISQCIEEDDRSYPEMKSSTNEAEHSSQEQSPEHDH